MVEDICVLTSSERKCRWVRPCGAGGRSRWLWIEEHFLKCLQHRESISENSVRQQERVEEVDVEESEVSKSLEQTFRSRVSDLGNLEWRIWGLKRWCSTIGALSRRSFSHLTRIEGLAEANVDVILE